MCQTTSQPLTALVPSQQVNSIETVGGLTIAASPTLWFYVPYALQDDDVVEFVLQDEQHNIVYQTTLNHSQLAKGIMSVSLAQAKLLSKPINYTNGIFWFIVTKIIRYLSKAGFSELVSILS